MTSPTREEILHLFGPIADHTVVEVLETGATPAELEEVAMRLSQEDDVLGDLRKPLALAAAQVFDIVMKDELYAENDRGRENPVNGSG